MTPTRDSNARHRLEVIPGGGPIIAQRVLLAAAADEGAHLLSWHAEGVWSSVAVEVVASPHVPADVVAVTDDLAAELGIDPRRPPRWRLDAVQAVPARRVLLEIPTEDDPQAAVRNVAKNPLVGRLLWLPPDDREITIPIGGDPYRLREIDAGGRTGVVAQITNKTAVELYAPAARIGVDVVILADGSGSMAVDDLPVAGEHAAVNGTTRWTRRIEALRTALNDLLATRLQVSGRVSHIALLEFGETVVPLFPRGGGMVQLDGGSPPEVIDSFRHAVASIRTASPETNIGNALHEAANLLYRYGRPGNDKLIVLVSDGADWRPAGDEGIGEVVFAYQEPVSLMAHLHRDMKIKLHAIAIGTDALFHQRGTYPPRPQLVPNHTLLQELVKVSGGDPTSADSREVLERYFSGLGAGVVHPVTETLRGLPSSRGRPLDVTLAALRALAGPTHGWDTERDALHDDVAGLVGACCDESERALGRLLWKPMLWSATITRDCGRTVSGDDQLRAFLLGVSGALAPEPDTVGRAAALGPWATLMANLRDSAKGAAPDYAGLQRLCGHDLKSAPQAQVAVLRAVRAGLVALKDGLAVEADGTAALLAAEQSAAAAAAPVSAGHRATAAAVDLAAAPAATPRYRFRMGV